MENRQVQVQPQELTVPTELVPLPSNGVVYPVDSPVYNKQGVEIRSMTAREEDILTSRALLKSGKAMDMLLKSCVLDKSIDIENMLIGDRNAILIGIRITGYGNEYNVTLQCPSCESEMKSTIDLTSLPLKRMPRDVKPLAPGKNEFSFTMPSDGRVVIFKLMTGKDENEMTSIADAAKKAGMHEELVTTRLKTQILSINGETDRTKIAGLVRNMPARDSRALRKYIDEITPGVLMETNMTCSNCGEETKGVEVPLGTEFFWPSS